MTRTPEERAAAEREFAAAAMQNLRQRGVLTAPAPAGHRPPYADALDELLAAPAPGAAAPELAVSAEQHAAWVAQPQAMTDAEHAEWCDSGFIVVGQDLHSRRCPRCAAAEQATQLRTRLIAAGVDGRYLDPTWDDLEQPAPLDRVAAACDQITRIIDAGQSLLLWSGETGSGKTQAAMLAAAAAVRAGRTAHVANLARLAVEIRDGYGDRSGVALKEGAALARLTAPDLLVIDDLGAGETDSAAVERRLLFLALDQRQMHRRPTIVTTNLDPKELAALFGARIIARLQPLTVIHVNHGKNFRAARAGRSLW